MENETEIGTLCRYRSDKNTLVYCGYAVCINDCKHYNGTNRINGIKYINCNKHKLELLDAIEEIQ
jgi:hypothetical protein